METSNHEHIQGDKLKVRDMPQLMEIFRQAEIEKRLKGQKNFL